MRWVGMLLVLVCAGCQIHVLENVRTSDLSALAEKMPEMTQPLVQGAREIAAEGRASADRAMWPMWIAVLSLVAIAVAAGGIYCRQMWRNGNGHDKKH